MAGNLSLMLAMVVAITMVSFSTATCSANVTNEFLIIQQKLKYCNTTYPQASAFLTPVIEYAELGAQSNPPTVLQVLRKAIDVLDDLVFANFGGTPVVPPGLSQCLQEVINKLLCLLYTTKGAYRILVAFLLAILYLIKAILFPQLP